MYKVILFLFFISIINLQAKRYKFTPTFGSYSYKTLNTDLDNNPRQDEKLPKVGINFQMIDNNKEKDLNRFFGGSFYFPFFSFYDELPNGTNIKDHHSSYVYGFDLEYGYRWTWNRIDISPFIGNNALITSSVTMSFQDEVNTFNNFTDYLVLGTYFDFHIYKYKKVKSIFIRAKAYYQFKIYEGIYGDTPTSNFYDPLFLNGFKLDIGIGFQEIKMTTSEFYD